MAVLHATIAVEAAAIAPLKRKHFVEKLFQTFSFVFFFNLPGRFATVAPTKLATTPPVKQLTLTPAHPTNIEIASKNSTQNTFFFF